MLSSDRSAYDDLPFYDFIEVLKAHGFSPGVGCYLRLRQTLELLGPGVPLSELKDYLCPVFASDEKSQREFHRVFDAYFHAYIRAEKGSEKSGDSEAEEGTGEEEKPDPMKEVETALRLRPYVLLMALLLLTVVFIPEQIHERIEQKPKVTVSGEEIVPGAPGAPDQNAGKIRKVTYEIAPKETVEPTWWQRYGRWVRLALVIAPPVWFLLTEYRRRKFRRLALQKARGKKPPFVWPLRVGPSEPPFLKSALFYACAARLRKRTEGETRRIDIDGTVRKTVGAFGYPDFSYRPATRPPEYLVLNNTGGFRDHFSRYVVSLVEKWKEEGVYVRMFHYRDDPRICFEQPDADPRYLEDLCGEFRHRRLVLAGEGDALFDPVTGLPEPWTEVFETWKDRAVLTPRHACEWTLREKALAETFAVLPARLEGFAALTGAFENPDLRDLKKWVRKDKGTGVPAPDRIEDPEALKAYLAEPDLFQWLCACAVYPELHWDLTLHLASFCLDGGQPTEAQLLRLVRLPWFKTGFMPESLRLDLIRRLESHRLAAIRSFIFEVLEKNPPPEDSAAFDGYRLNLAVHSSLVPRKRRRKMKEMAALLDPAKIAEDHTLLRLLESPPRSPLVIRLPERLKRILFRDGIPLFGTRSAVRFALFMFLSLVFFFAVPVPEPLTQPPPSGTMNLEFAYVPAGKFMMGSPENELGRYNNEILHPVELTRPFYMQTTEVTQGQWKQIMGNNPSDFKECGDDCPVENVSWKEAQEFIAKLNRLEGSEIYRLPTEAEWEYACRAESKTAFANGEITNEECSDPNLDKIGWYCGNAGEKTHPVARKDANKWNIHDMHGNVWEWCQDWYGEYGLENAANPEGPADGTSRVVRGGGWGYRAGFCRSANRGRSTPGNRNQDLGFRLLRSVP